MTLEFETINQKASDYLKYILKDLEMDPDFYGADFEVEYSSFEQSLKEYCDSYFDFYIQNDAHDVFFDALVSITEAIAECRDDFYYYEEFFRPMELITYYFGKLAFISDYSLKEDIYEWISDFCKENKDDFIVDEYLAVFINGEKISRSDSYYTNYKDFNRMVSVFRKRK